MNVPCNVILDLLPLVKDNVASEDSVNLVLEHIKSCESCKHELGSSMRPIQEKADDNAVLSSIRKKLLLASAALLVLGTLIGIALSNNDPSFIAPAIITVLAVGVTGILVLKSNSKGDVSMRRFFAGRAIGTIIIFVILGIYLLLRYVFHLF